MIAHNAASRGYQFASQNQSLVLRISRDLDGSIISRKIPFHDMLAHALDERAAGASLELHEFGNAVVLFSPDHSYAYINERSAGVGDSLVVYGADSARLAAKRWPR